MADMTNSTGSIINIDSAVYATVGVSWIMMCAFLVISMQLGFAMLEVGSVRKAHRDTVLAKNVLDSVVSCVCFWLYVEIFRPSIIVDGDGNIQYHLLLFQWAFCATSVTICSGAMAERTHLAAYLAYSVAMSGIIYPMVAEAAWGSEDSLLSQFFTNPLDDGYVYHDFAGSGVVHFVGGVSALVGNSFLGRRIMKPSRKADGGAVTRESSASSTASQEQRSGGRSSNRSWQDVFKDADEEEKRRQMLVRPEGGWPRRFDDEERDAQEFKGLEYLQVMGTLFLWVGWYAFNSGSTLAMDAPSAFAASVAAWNTSLAAAAGGLGACLNSCVFKKKPIDVCFMCNGILAGLVGITASCDVAQDYSALIAGFVAGFVVYPGAKFVMEQKVRLDDVVDAVPVHAACGAWAVLFVAFCQPKCNYLAANGDGIGEQQRFCSEEFSIAQQLLAQTYGLVGIFVWVFSTSFVLWFVFAISEHTRAQEVPYLEKADELLLRITGGAGADGPLQQAAEPGDALSIEGDDDWMMINRYSTLFRGVYEKHGKRPRQIFLFRKDLQQVRHAKAETALEVAHRPAEAHHHHEDGGGHRSSRGSGGHRGGAGRALPVLSAGLERIARCFHRVRVLRILARLRLRVSPFAELKGLGAADAEGVSFLVEVLKKNLTDNSDGQELQGLIDMLHQTAAESGSGKAESRPSQQQQLPLQQLPLQQPQLHAIPEASGRRTPDLVPPKRMSATALADEGLDERVHERQPYMQPYAPHDGPVAGFVKASSNGRSVANHSGMSAPVGPSDWPGFAASLAAPPAPPAVPHMGPSPPAVGAPAGGAGSEQFMQQWVQVGLRLLSEQQNGGAVVDPQEQYRHYVPAATSEYSTISGSTMNTQQGRLGHMPLVPA